MKIREQYPLLDNVKIDPRLLGDPATQNPDADKTSASRANMFASHTDQIMVIVAPEGPRQLTGYEHYTNLFPIDDSADRRQDMQVLQVIPKYRPSGGAYSIEKNPIDTVIALGLDDNLIHCFDVNYAYVCGRDGYGYQPIVKNRPMKDWPLPKSMPLTTSAASDGPLRKIGLNLKTIFITLPEGIEDAMLVSRSAAERMKTYAFYKVSIIIRPDTVPVNCYGSEFEHRIVPDIGQKVGKDGILCAFRPVRQESFAADCDPTLLGRVQTLTDTVFYAVPDAEIVDVDFYTSPKRPAMGRVYEQADKYQEAITVYWQRIIAVYEEYKARYHCSAEFNTKVATAVTRLAAMRAKIPGSFKNNHKTMLRGRNGRDIDFMQIDIVYKVERPLANGSKITDRHGGKGVICHIVDDADMPTDQWGRHADLAVDPASPIARMNVGQLYEHAINYTSDHIAMRLPQVAAEQGKAAAVALLLDYYADINPNFAKLVTNTYRTQQELERHLAHVIRHGIDLWRPPALEHTGPALLRHLQAKWQLPFSTVSYAITLADGTKKRFTTDETMVIADKYVLLLCKLPEPTAAGVARISHLGVPIKPHADGRLMHPIAYTPVKLGEDEGRLMMMDQDPGEVMRLVGLQANSPTAVSTAVCQILASPDCANIPRIDIDLEHIRATNGTIAIFHHLMRTLGVESQYTRTNLTIPDDGSDIIVDPDDPFSKIKLGTDDEDQAPKVSSEYDDEPGEAEPAMVVDDEEMDIIMEEAAETAAALEDDEEGEGK